MTEDRNSDVADDRSSPTTGQFPRRIFIVDPRLQFRIVLHLILLSAMSGVLGGLLTAFYVFHLTSSHPGQDPNAHLQVVFLGLAVASSALLIVALAGIFISHAIAGPVHRFRKIMQAVARKQEIPTVALRRHDYLHGMARDLETLLATLHGETEAAAQTAREAAEDIARTVAALKASGKADATLLAELAEIQARLTRAAGESKSQ